jgi:hypothetical protein
LFLGWHTIRNIPSKQRGDRQQKGAGLRSFKPANQECFDLFGEIFVALKNCGLANEYHDIRLARGASWVRSTKGTVKQTEHLDFMAEVRVSPHSILSPISYLSHRRQGLLNQLQMPMSIFVYLQDSPLSIERNEFVFHRGDIIIFLGDCVHAGGAWLEEMPNHRLFCYLPSKYCTQSWSSLIESDDGMLPIEVTLRVVFCLLNSNANPVFFADEVACKV